MLHSSAILPLVLSLVFCSSTIPYAIIFVSMFPCQHQCISLIPQIVTLYFISLFALYYMRLACLEQCPHIPVPNSSSKLCSKKHLNMPSLNPEPTFRIHQCVSTLCADAVWRVSGGVGIRHSFSHFLLP